MTPDQTIIENVDTPAFKAMQKLYRSTMQRHEQLNKEAHELELEARDKRTQASVAAESATSFMEALITLGKK